MAETPVQGLLATLEEQRVALRRFLVARTGSESDADDLLSELWIKSQAGATGPIANPGSYLFRMANNLVLDRLREARRRSRRERDWTGEFHGDQDLALEIADTSPTSEQLLIEREEARHLREAIAQLPPGAQRVLKMHKIDGLSHAAVAESLGITKSAVEKHMAVAMAHLRRILRDWGND
ncbi:RNA polymerase sigma factor [Sphingomonas alba]|uniref:RNA polymerase sigma factor n=1 Tax=Sphingomonas alba TaxID=2908208 RepID=A0ABT0RPC7_9SPHN|nr:RNA polymerase sigma factor [Sphingomonas alba]MCL6684492.1 RNA polymerase sigma factor [Sphingomonas alba]